MLALGIPASITAILIGLAVSHAFPGAFLLTLFGIEFVYSILYCLAFRQFQHTWPARPLMHFYISVTLVQLVLLAAVVLAFVA